MEVCLNNIPLEQESCERRSGLAFLVPTKGRKYAQIIPFDGSPTCAFAMEFTDDAVRFITQSSLVFDNSVFTVNSETTGTLTLSDSPTWSVGDEIMFAFPDVSSSLYPYDESLTVGLRGRVLTVASLSTTSLTLADDLGNDLDSTNWPAGALVGAQVMRVKVLTTTYAGQTVLDSLRSVQAENQAIILTGTVAPQSVRITTDGTLSADPVFAIDALNFVDGPYLDPSGDTCTVSAYTGTITVTASTTTPFASTDVGRHIRLFSQPAAWASGTAYVSGNYVTDANGSWWQAIASSTGVPPGTLTVVGGINTVVWVPAPNAGSWAWGKITAFTSSSSVSVALDTSIPGMVLNSANGTTMNLFRLGVFSSSSAYPTCGAFHQGRLWLAGAIANRFDASTTNSLIITSAGAGQVTFSPTDPNGNVLDDSAIGEVLNSRNLVQIQWLTPHDEVLIAGTLAGEFVIRASALNDPITPTSIDAKMATRFGSTNIEPVEGSMAVVFVQKYGKLCIEYVADAFSGKFSGRHLNKDAKHLAASGIKRLAHQIEPTPIIWALMNNGLLVGASYHRTSRFVTEPPDLNGWHWHMHGGNKIFTSMCVVPGKGGLRDRLYLITNPPEANTTVGGKMPNQGLQNGFYVTVLQPLLPESATIRQGWFVDEAPGLGPGTSGTDCGGGNAFTFTPTHATGSDTVVPDMSTVQPFPGLPAPGGTSEPTTAAFLGMGPAVAFDGNTALYGLPKASDTTSVSMSVWITANSLVNMQAGALLGSPALQESEAGGSQVVANLLAGKDGGLWAAAAGNGATTGSGTHPPAILSLDFTPYTGTAWAHVMISAKTDGAGNIVVIMAVNDTVVFNSSNQTTGVVGNNNDMWPHATQPGVMKDLGIAAWTIGGVNVVEQDYGDTLKIFPGPTLVETITALQATEILAMISQYGRNATVVTAPSANKTALATFQDVAAALSSLTYSTTYQNEQSVLQKGNGGNSNIPVGNSVNGYQGFAAQGVNELWIATGSFIDWTSSINRYKFHSKDSTTEVFFPVSLGKDGSAPSGSAPWIYCAGGAKYFSVNRATGKTLTVSGLLTDSPVNWPPGT